MKLAIIGAGIGGYSAALLAAKNGIAVVLFEEREIGGTCLNRGCIPTKTLLHSAQKLDSVSHTAGLVGTVSLDMPALQAHRIGVIEQLQKGIISLLKQQKIEVNYGHATIVDEHHIECENETITVDKILIASGSLPACPKIEGIESDKVINSDELLESEQVFDSLLIIGGGVIGMEFASLYAALGKKVYVVEAAMHILPSLDKDIATNLKQIMKKKQVEIYEQALVKRVEDDTVFFEHQNQLKEIKAERILVATGRVANTEHLFKTGFIQMNKDRIQVNEHFQTSQRDVYAIGDAIEGPQLAHLAAAQATHCISHLLDKDATVDLNTLCSCIYTQPEIAIVGLSLEEAINSGIQAKQIKYPMSANGKTVLSQQERGFIKLVINEEDHTLLGAQLMCARASDLIAQCAQAIVNHLKYEDIIRTIHPHPTFAESIKEALEQLD